MSDLWRPGRGLLDTSEAAGLLGVSTRRVRVLLNEGRLLGGIIGGVWLVDASSVDSFVRNPVGRPRKTPK